MKIKIYRGSHEIGGCATEISTEKTRIIIDFGSSLNGGENLAVEGVTDGVSECDGVLFTHYHGDHVGECVRINSDIPLYMGEFTRRITEDTSHEIRTFTAGEKFTIGDIEITPFFVDHSAYDAYMFLIEAEGKRILHTGDFRNHGFRGKGLFKVLERLPHIDCLICEGTTLNRDGARAMTEYELSLKARKIFKENKGVFVLCASTNIDRLAGFYSAVPRGKYCLCDETQMKIIKTVREFAKSDLYSFEKMLKYGENLDEKMEKAGFCMFVRGNARHKKILEKFPDAPVVYSMWSGYRDREYMQEFLNGRRVITLHVSGHTDKSTLKAVIEKISPRYLVPIHTETPEEFLKICENAVILNDGEEMEI